MPAALTKPVPSIIKLLGSGVAATELTIWKPVKVPLELDVKVNEPAVLSKPDSTIVPLPLRVRVPVGPIAATDRGPLIVKLSAVGPVAGTLNRTTPSELANEKLVRLAMDPKGAAKAMVPLEPTTTPVVGLNVIAEEV